jgi:hypothetical protein
MWDKNEDICPTHKIRRKYICYTPEFSQNYYECELCEKELKIIAEKAALARLAAGILIPTLGDQATAMKEFYSRNSK